MQADYVIVGAGSAGCVLANRLTEDPATRVVLIEAGGRDWNPLIHIPAGFMKLLDHPTLTWGFKAEADPGTNGRPIPYPRGRVLGGSSSINGLIYIRGQPEDFDHWAQLGNRGWGWDELVSRPISSRPRTGRARPASCTAKAGPEDLANERAPAGVPGDHRCRPGDRARIPAGRQQSAAGRRGQHRVVPADPRRSAPGQRRAHLSAAGGKAAEFDGRHRGAGASRDIRRQARGRRRVLARWLRELHRTRRCGGRSDPRRRRGRLAAYLDNCRASASRRPWPRAASRSITSCPGSDGIFRTITLPACPAR